MSADNQSAAGSRDAGMNFKKCNFTQLLKVGRDRAGPFGFGCYELCDEYIIYGKPN